MAKIFKFEDNNGINVEYVTDCIGLQETFHVTEIRGLDSVDIKKGLDFNILPYTIEEFKAFAKENGLTLYIYETDKNKIIHKGGFDILSYSFAEQTATPVVIDAEAGTVDIEVANGTDVSGLVATFGLSDGALAKVDTTEQVSGTTTNDFTSAVTYIVTSGLEGIKNWVITVTVAV